MVMWDEVMVVVNLDKFVVFVVKCGVMFLLMIELVWEIVSV